ncbi:MAG: glycogen synthase [Actinomycetales bacterium]
MRVDLLTKEYPPKVYGGAGVHVEELVRALRGRVGTEALDVRVRCFGEPRDEDGTTGYADPPSGLESSNATLQTIGVDLPMASDCGGADVVHSHTWYAGMAGHLAGLLHGVPHVATAHSLEPLRPWKAEQLGGGYRLSSWIERMAFLNAAGVIAVSDGMRRDILRCYPDIDPERVFMVHNGIDTQRWSHVSEPELVRRHGVDPDQPSVVFVGRITRQKGLPYFLRAAAELPPDVQLVLCAGAPDTKEIAAEVAGLVADLRATRRGVVWIDEMLPQPEVAALLSAGTVFACPSVYEPLGIVNLEAMACELAVVATATGGIPEVVADGQTGWLVPIEQVQDGTGTPVDPDRFVADMAATLVEAVSDPGRAAERGRAGRRRAQEEFSWGSIASRTVQVYDSVLKRAG